MAGSDLPRDPQKALEFKKKGNDHFGSGNYEAAEQLYSKALVWFPFSFRASVPLSLSSWLYDRYRKEYNDL